ncbi:hypothetical protein CPB86DRAFT_867425 [Serendipita vermifera]|nr:hypothetical protein CPB86DRAFT_867425 [Serendipita vermifera]
MSNPVRTLVFHKKNEGISDEEFRRNWEKFQGPGIVPLMKKWGVLYYSQQTYPSQDSQSVISQALFEDTSRTLDYDGIATVVFPSLEAAEGFSKDQEHEKMLKDYPKVYTQVGSIRIIAGEEVVFLNPVVNK